MKLKRDYPQLVFFCPSQQNKSKLVCSECSKTGKVLNKLEFESDLEPDDEEMMEEMYQKHVHRNDEFVKLRKVALLLKLKKLHRFPKPDQLTVCFDIAYLILVHYNVPKSQSKSLCTAPVKFCLTKLARSSLQTCIPSAAQEEVYIAVKMFAEKCDFAYILAKMLYGGRFSD